MTQNDSSQTSEAIPEQPQTSAQIPNTINEVSPEQWQAFVGQLSDQNNMLQAQLQQTNGRLAEITTKERKEALEGMSDKERADMLQKQMEAIQAVGTQVQAQDVSNTVWQRRDADAAARVLQSHGLKGDEPELYRAPWDVNWMPRFAASVDALVKTKASQRQTPANDNPANRANVGSGGSPMPEIDPGANGFDTIRFALQRGR
jgi:hypothetical protein